MNIFHDPEFGPIQLESVGWTLERSLMFNGVELPIRIEPEKDDPPEISPVQRQALREVLSLPPDVLERSAPAVVQNYEVYREMLGDDELPPLGVPTDVWGLIEPSYIMVEKHDQVTTPTFFLLAECDWDPEHGLIVRFHQGYADAADQQGELGLTD